MKTLTVFEFEGVLFRPFPGKDGEPWFIAADVCKILGIGNVSHALRRLDQNEKGIAKNDTLGGAQEQLIVSESGLYVLIMRSNKPVAVKFQRWVTQDVLPAIRKRGFYADVENPATPEAVREEWRKVYFEDGYIEMLNRSWPITAESIRITPERHVREMREIRKVLN